jgi:hypothetical protein
MAIVFDGPVTPDAATAFVRRVPTPQNQVLNQLLPDRTISAASVDITEVTRTSRTAKFRTFDGRPHRTSRDSLQTRSVKLPPLSVSNGIGEAERLQLEFARTGGQSYSALADAIYDDATNLVQEVRARMELARGDVLTDGKFTLAGENGLYLEADFGVPPSNFVTAATAWSNFGASQVVRDLRAWVQAYVDLNGFRPGGFVCSEAVLGYMLQNAELRTLSASLSGTPQLVTEQALAAALNVYRLPPLLFTYDTKLDVDGTTTPVLDPTKVIFVPPNPADLGFTAWGVTATALELVNSAKTEFSFDDAPGIVGLVVKGDSVPFTEETVVDAVGMPVLQQPKLLMVADVA